MTFSTKQLIAATAMGFAICSSAHAVDWDGTGDGVSFEDALNWADDDVTFADGTRNINGEFIINRDVDITVSRTFIGGGAVMNISSGTHSDNQSGASIYNFVGNNSAGTVNQSGGSYNIGHGLRVGSGNENSDGAYNLSGGSLNVSRGANSAIESTNPGGRPSLQIGSPTADATGILEVSGGSLITRFGTHLGDGGTISVVGSNATSIGIGNNSNGDGWWLQRAGGTLQASIDAGGVTPIFVDDNNDDGAGIYAEFEAGSLLDLSFAGISPVAGTWTIMEVENADISITGTGANTGYTLGLELSAATEAFDGTTGWSFDVDNSGANGLLTATYTGVTATPLVGDYNSDGFVSQGDLDLVLLNWGDATAPAGFDETNLEGGGPFDGLMSQNELDGVLLNWGDGVAPSLSAVPEPASLALLSLGGLAMMSRRRK